MCIRFMSGNREISEAAVVSPEGSPAGEGQGRNPGVYVSEKSDRLIGPEKPSNNASSITHGVTMERRRRWRKGA